MYNEYTNENRDLLYNKRYQQQILTELPCTGITEKRLIRVDYQADDLRSLFKDYNECKGTVNVEFSKAKKGALHLKVFAGAYNASTETNLGIISGFFSNGLETSTEWSPTFGVELEYIFPFNKNKWAMFVAPNYSSYEGETERVDLSSNQRFEITYRAIQIPIGFRHYMFINDTSKLFVSAAAVFDIGLQGETSGNFVIDEEVFSTQAGFSFGLGYSYDKYSIEVRYLPQRQLLGKGTDRGIELELFGITLGYRYTIF